jgi:succinate dehydrogenase flavoprotein subunit
VARAALIREESRGAHYRVDFEGERDEWLQYNIVSRMGNDGRMEVEKVRRPEGPPQLTAIAQAKIEDLEAGRVAAPAQGA